MADVELDVAAGSLVGRVTGGTDVDDIPYATIKTELGLGSAAYVATTTFDAAGAATAVGVTAAANLASHEADTTNIHGIADTSILALSANVVAKTQTINAQTGTTYTLVVSDSTKLITQSNASAITTTVPQDSDVTWAIGDYCEIYQLGAGQITVVAGSGATLRSTPTAKSRAQYSRLFLQKIAANTWALSGDVGAS